MGKNELNLQLWLAYSAFHFGDYKKAMEVISLD
jgi:hypothetical protein